MKSKSLKREFIFLLIGVLSIFLTIFTVVISYKTANNSYAINVNENRIVARNSSNVINPIPSISDFSATLNSAKVNYDKNQVLANNDATISFAIPTGYSLNYSINDGEFSAITSSLSITSYGNYNFVLTNTSDNTTNDFSLLFLDASTLPTTINANFYSYNLNDDEISLVYYYDGTPWDYLNNIAIDSKPYITFNSVIENNNILHSKTTNTNQSEIDSSKVTKTSNSTTVEVNDFGTYTITWTAGNDDTLLNYTATVYSFGARNLYSDKNNQNNTPVEKELYYFDKTNKATTTHTLANNTDAAGKLTNVVHLNQVPVWINRYDNLNASTRSMNISYRAYGQNEFVGLNQTRLSQTGRYFIAVTGTAPVGTINVEFTTYFVFDI